MSHFSLIPLARLVLRLILGLIVTLRAPLLLALDEERFEQEYETRVKPLLDRAESGSWQSADGVRLVYHIVSRDGDRPAVLLVTGYSESWMNYGELILDLDEAGYDVYVMDHRGMGFSGRLAPDPRVAHVERFSDYVDDLQYFLKTIVQNRVKGPLHLVAHSMGGLVGAYLVQREPTAFRTVSMTAPLFELNTGRVPQGLAYLTARLNTTLGMGSSFAPGQGGYDPETADPSRCNTTKSITRCRHQINMYRSIPQTFQAGPSNQWVKTVIEATRSRQDLARAFGSLPTLILQASHDDFVRPSGQRQFCQRAPACRLQEIPESYHDILQETDGPRRRALEALFQHLRG